MPVLKGWLETIGQEAAGVSPVSKEGRGEHVRPLAEACLRQLPTVARAFGPPDATPSPFFIGWAAGARKVLSLDLLDVEFGGAVAHGLEHFFERRRIAFDPAQRIDARDHKRAQVRTHQRSEEHTSELQSRLHLVCRLL